MVSFFLLALGGALGSVLRYACSLVIAGPQGFPLATLVVNFLGSFLIGFSSVLFAQSASAKNWDLFVSKGLCGGFTTFSSFSLENMSLLEQGRYLMACSYIGLSLALCLIGVSLGTVCAKRFT